MHRGGEMLYAMSLAHDLYDKVELIIGTTFLMIALMCVQILSVGKGNGRHA